MFHKKINYVCKMKISPPLSLALLVLKTRKCNIKCLFSKKICSTAFKNSQFPSWQFSIMYSWQTDFPHTFKWNRWYNSFIISLFLFFSIKLSRLIHQANIVEVYKHMHEKVFLETEFLIRDLYISKHFCICPKDEISVQLHNTLLAINSINKNLKE